jgi:hypothetical protein
MRQRMDVVLAFRVEWTTTSDSETPPFLIVLEA